MENFAPSPILDWLRHCKSALRQQSAIVRQAGLGFGTQGRVSHHARYLAVHLSFSYITPEPLSRENIEEITHHTKPASFATD